MECSFCSRECPNSFYIECAVCNNVNLCVDCFSAGVEFHEHENHHSYHVPYCLEFPLFSKDWLIKEEIQLLEGILKFGMGNWKTISENNLPTKSSKQIEDHYWEMYMGLHGFCLPQNFLYQNEFVETSAYLSNLRSENLHVSDTTPGYMRGDFVVRDLGKENAPKLKDRNEILQKIALLPGSDLPGFMPLREDFEIEYENDAELMLADMEFGADDHPSEIELKLQVIRIYNQKLAERDRRKRFVIERGLVDVKSQQVREKKLSKEERDLCGRLRMFARFQSKEDFDALCEGILKARRLRSQIELYTIYRQMGFTTLQEIKDFEQDKKNMEREVKFRRQREAASYLYDGKGGSTDDLLEIGSDLNDLRRKRRGGRPSNKNFQVEEGDKKRQKLNECEAKELNLSKIDQLRLAPGGHLLTDLELELCYKVSLFPLHLLEIKRVLLREKSASNLSEQEIGRLVRLEESNLKLIYDHYIKPTT